MTKPKDPDTLDVVQALIRPLARLALAGGVPCPHVEEALREAFFQAAQESLAASGLPAHRQVSRISAATGLTRREIDRLTRVASARAAGEVPAPRRAGATVSWPNEVFTRWITDRSLRNARGRVMPLPRTGEAPSFESLARSVTQNIHPRSLLEELCRLGVARWDEHDDTVHALAESFVPERDRATMLGFMRDNVGDHLQGVVHNLLGDGSRPHLDQAVFADELSTQSLDEARRFVAAQWQRLLQEAVPVLERLIEADRAAGRPRDQRMRVGIYSYEAAMATPPATPADAAATPRRPGRKTPAPRGPKRG